MNNAATNLAGWVADYYLLATLLLGVMLLARRTLQQPARRIAVAWGGTLSLLLLAMLVALPGWSVIHLVEHEQPNLPAAELTVEQPVVPVATPHSMPTFVSEAPLEPAPLSRLPTGPPMAETPPAEATPEPAPQPPRRIVATMVTATFAAGTVITAAWCLVGAWQLRRLVRRSIHAPAELDTLLTSIGDGQTLPRLRLSDELKTAVALGILRPTILLPTSFAQRHGQASLRTALAHELAHVRNGDLWLVALLRVTMLLLWAHPGYWLVRRGVRLDQELLADAAAAEVTSRDSYAAQLVGWARAMPAHRGPAMAGAVGLWETRSQLGQRIRLLLDERLMIVRSCSRGWKVAAMGLCVAIGIGLSLVTLEPQSSRADEPATPDGEVAPGAEVASAADYPHLKAFEVRVVDALGNPIEGAEVTPWALRSSLGHGLWRTPDDNPKEPPTVVSDAQGIAKVPYPEYSRDNTESLTTSVTCRVTHPAFAEVASEHIAVPGDLATIEMRRGAIVRLTGLVDDEPVPAGELRALWSSSSFRGKGTPDDEGYLVLPRLPAGPELIRLVRISELAPLVISRVIEVELLEGGEYFLIGELEPPAGVSGRLSDNVPRPVRNGWVVAEIVTPVLGEGGEDLGWRTHAPVAEDGTFELANLPAGEPLQIIAGCDGFAAASGSPPAFVPVDDRRPSSLNDPQTFVLSAEVNEVTVEMVPTATLEVHVVDEEGKPVEGVTVGASPNVKWWGSGSQIYGEYRYDLVDVLKSGDRPDFSRDVTLYQSTTDASGVATIKNVPANGRPREHLYLFSSGEPSVLLGNPQGHVISARQGETTQTTITIDRSKLPAVEATEKEKEEAAAISPEMSIVIAKHYMLLDGKTPITWLEIEERIKQLDPPSSAQLHYWFTNGAYADGAQEFWRVEHDRLRQEYKLGGYSMGSLSPRTGAINDKLETLDDFAPDPVQAVAGQVLDGEGKPVAGAEVLLIEPVEEDVAYKTIGVYIVEGRLRNRLDEVVVDSDREGRFTHYTSTDDVHAYLVAMHPEYGFAIARQKGLTPTEPLALRPWGRLKGEITPQEGYKQSASVVSVVEESEDWPTLQFHQMTVDRDPEREAPSYLFSTIPPDLRTMLQRSIEGDQGSSFSLPGKELTLTPGEERSEPIGPLTEEDKERINMLQELSNRPYSPN